MKINLNQNGHLRILILRIANKKTRNLKETKPNPEIRIIMLIKINFEMVMVDAMIAMQETDGLLSNSLYKTGQVHTNDQQLHGRR